MAITVTTQDFTSYRRIFLNGTGDITLDEVYQQLYTLAGDAETYMTKTGTAGAYVYTCLITGANTYQQFYVNTGNFIMSDGDTLNTTRTLTGNTTNWSFYLNTNGTLTMGAGCTIDLNSNDGNFGYGRFGMLGTVYVNGTAENPSYFKGFRDWYSYMQSETPWDVNYAIWSEATINNATLRFLGSFDTTNFKGWRVPHSFRNCSAIDTAGNLVFVIYGNIEKWTMENWTLDNVRPDFRNANFTMKNATIQNIEANCYFSMLSMGYSGSAYSPSTDANRYYNNKDNQSLAVFDTCTFDTSANNYLTWLYAGSTAVFDNCTFQNASVAIRNEDSNVIFAGTNTFNSISTKQQWVGSGTYYYANQLMLTIQDLDGNPIENASVSIRTKLTRNYDGREYPYESWQFYTDQNGQVLRSDGHGIFLIEKEETSLNNFVQWSDGTGDNVHIITVSHPDYATHKEEIAMTEDKTRTITLSAKEGTHIYDSTLYDTTLY